MMLKSSEIPAVQDKDIPESSFTNFMWKSRVNRMYLWGALAMSLLLLIIFKAFYPYPNLVLDSYYYTLAAAQNWDINAWPIGYSKFIRVIGWFSHSPLVLVYVQYLFLQLCNSLFFFTLLYFYRPGKVVANILFVFLFLNPIFLYLANLIMADALFTALSILWTTQLFWIIYRPRPYMILTHAVLLVAAFTVRYNAMYYPLIASLAFILSRQRVWLKLAGIGLHIALLGGFILYTSNRVASMTGERQFSPFSNWKIANDALFMYAHIHPGKSDPLPEKFQSLDTIVRKFFDYTHDNGDLLRPDQYWGSFYMMSPYSPLAQYMAMKNPKDSGFINSTRWADVGPLYADYGSYLIRKYPIAYARYFLWPNYIRYTFPTLEIFKALSPFYLRDDDLGSIAKEWFSLKTLTVKQSYIDLRTDFFSYCRVFNLLVHLSFILGVIGFLLLKGWEKVSRTSLYSLILITALWLCNLGFNVFAAAVQFRYLMFILIIGFAFSLIFFEIIFQNTDPKTVSGSLSDPSPT